MDDSLFIHSLENKIADVKHGLSLCQDHSDIDQLFKIIDYVYGALLSKKEHLPLLVQAGFLIVKISLYKGYDIEGYVEVLGCCLEAMSD